SYRRQFPHASFPCTEISGPSCADVPVRGGTAARRRHSHYSSRTDTLCRVYRPNVNASKLGGKKARLLLRTRPRSEAGRRWASDYFPKWITIAAKSSYNHSQALDLCGAREIVPDDQS